MEALFPILVLGSGPPQLTADSEQEDSGYMPQEYVLINNNSGAYHWQIALKIAQHWIEVSGFLLREVYVYITNTICYYTLYTINNI